MIFLQKLNIVDSYGFKVYLLLLRNEYLRLHYIGPTLLSFLYGVS
jgi:hypothetical protein